MHMHAFLMLGPFFQKDYRLAWEWSREPLRTHEEAANIQGFLESGELDPDDPEAGGYKGRSPLLDIDGFDIIKVN